jgi:hypothetical protein
MTSQINPESNNYDAAYPVAGQDNNTIGFRQNFASIQQNFQYAKDEITALQTNTVQAGGNVLNDLNGAVIYDAKLQNQSYADINLGNTANIANVSIANVNYTMAAYQSLTPTADTTIIFSGLPANAAAILTLSITANAASNIATPYTVTIPNVSSATSGVIGLSGNILSFPRTNSTIAGTHTYQLLTTTGGSAFTITPLSTPTQPLNSTSEDVAPGANVNLGVSDSYFSTTASETATLPAGVNGQVKVLALYADMDDSSLDNMVITVTNAGWKTSGTGTITFDAIGDACTLKYINSKWFCIGNNGCVFA